MDEDFNTNAHDDAVKAVQDYEKRTRREKIMLIVKFGVAFVVAPVIAVLIIKKLDEVADSIETIEEN